MRNRLSSVLVLSVLALASQFSFATATPVFNPLSTAQCTKVRADLQIYIAAVNKALPNNPKIAAALIADGTAIANKLCPAPTWDNHFSTSSEYECTVVDSTGTTLVQLGVDSSLNFVSIAAPFKTACMSQLACLLTASTQLPVNLAQVTARCSDPNDQTVLHLTDAEVTTKTNALAPH